MQSKVEENTPASKSKRCASINGSDDRIFYENDGKYRERPDNGVAGAQVHNRLLHNFVNPVHNFVNLIHNFGPKSESN